MPNVLSNVATTASCLPAANKGKMQLRTTVGSTGPVSSTAPFMAGYISSALLVRSSGQHTLIYPYTGGQLCWEGQSMQDYSPVPVLTGRPRCPHAHTTAVTAGCVYMQACMLTNCRPSCTQSTLTQVGSRLSHTQMKVPAAVYLRMG